MKKLNGLHAFIFVLLSLCCWQCSEKPRVNITGTVVSLSPPEGFIQAPDLTGLRHEVSRATIMVVEMPREFNAVSEEVMDGDSLKNGLKVLSREPVRVDGREGVLYHLNRKNFFQNLNQWMLVLANSGYTTAVSGTYLARDEKTPLSDEIREALMTTHIGNSEDPLLQYLPFEINLETLPLRMAKVMPGPSVVYTTDGVWSDSAILSTSFYAGHSRPGKGALRTVTEEFVKTNFSKMCPMCEADSSGVQKIEVDNLKGFELWGYAKSIGKLKYQMLLDDNAGGYFLMVGTASADQDKYLNMFRSAGKTFKKREIGDKLKLTAHHGTE